MPELSNRDIDDLFQRGAERYDFEFKEEAWQHMEALLERDRRRRRLLWWVIGIFLALLLSVGAYRLWWASPEETPAPPREEQTPVATDNGEEFREDIVPANEAETPLSPGQLNDETISPAPPIPQAQRTEAPSPQEATHSPASIAENSDAAGQPQGTKQPAREGIRTNPLSTLEKLPLTKQEAALVPSNAPLQLEALPSRPLEQLANAFAILPASEKKPPISGPEKPKAANALVFGAGFSPESASIGTDDFGRVDFKAGLHLEYRFANHFALGAGIHYTRKHYDAGRGEYRPAEAFWTRQIAPERSYGYCSMLEVPLHFTYFLRRHDRNSLFLEAGLSNFVMLNEHYWYEYDRPDPDLIRYWASNFEYHAWMSILNISPGYQVRLSPRFGIQAAPFLQIPLTGVGHGRVDLYSIGLNLRMLFRTPVGR